MPEVWESKNDEMVVENGSPGGGNITYEFKQPTFSLMNTDTSQIYLLPVPLYYFDHGTNLTLTKDDSNHCNEGRNTNTLNKINTTLQQKFTNLHKVQLVLTAALALILI